MGSRGYHSNQSLIRLEQKHNYSFPLLIDAICVNIWKESEGKSFANLDGRTDDERLYTISSHMHI